MPTGRPTGQYDRPPNTMSASLRGEPVKRGSQLFRDLRQARVRGESVTRQRRRPATRENALGHASKYLLTAALPITAMNVNVARCLRIGSWIQVPLGPISLSISEIEVLRTLRAESLRGCSPRFGFRPRKFGSHVCHIVKGQVASFQRHGHPVPHAVLSLSDDFVCGNNSGGYDTSCSHRHESATVENDHDKPPCCLKSVGNPGTLRWRASAVAYVPDGICQTRTLAVPGADATARSLSVVIYGSGVLAMAQRLRACVAGVGNSFGSIGISTIAGLPAASAAFIVSAT